MGYRNRCEIHLAVQCHKVVMHCIAQLAIFIYNRFLRKIMAMINNRTCCNRMLVRPYHKLPCRKAKQKYPGSDNMVDVCFQVSRLFAAAAKIVKKSIKKTAIAIGLQLNMRLPLNCYRILSLQP
jgi:hypothetical protein